RLAGPLNGVLTEDDHEVCEVARGSDDPEARLAVHEPARVLGHGRDVAVGAEAYDPVLVDLHSVHSFTRLRFGPAPALSERLSSEPLEVAYPDRPLQRASDRSTS